MNPQPTTRELVEEILKGNFRHVRKNYTSKQHYEKAVAVKFIAAVCNACHSNMSSMEKLDELEMAALLKDLLRFIHVPNEAQFQNYVQSVIFILKFLVEKKSLDCVVSLESLFIPDFMPGILTDDHKTVYTNICKLFYNVIVKVMHSKDPRKCPIALKLSHLLAKIYKKLDKPTSVLERAHDCFLALISLEIPPEDLVNFHRSIMGLVGAPLFALTTTNLSLVYNYCLKKEKPELATKTLNQTLTYFTVPKSREFDWLRTILGVANWLMGATSSNHAHSTLKQYHRVYGATPNLQAACEFISTVSASFLVTVKKSGSWDQTVEAQSDFYRFLNDVAVIISKSPYKGGCGCTTNLHEACRTLDTIGGLGKLAIVKSDVSRTYKLDVFRVLEKMFGLVEKLKSNGCEKWTNCWYNCGVHLYTIGMQCCQRKDIDMLVAYLQKFVKSVLELEGYNPKVIQKTYLNSALNSVSKSYFDNCDHQRALIFTALALIFSESPKVEMGRWLWTKIANRENSIEENRELQELTIVGVFDRFGDELGGYLPQGGLTLPPQKKIELLLLELRTYNSKWKSRIPMSATFGELREIAEGRVSARVFIEIWGEGECAVHDSIPRHLRETIKSLKTDTCEDRNVLLAHLYFLQHKYQIKEAVVKNCDEIEKTMMGQEESKDPDSECDLVSSYENLRLSKYLKMMKFLDTALEMVADESRDVFKLAVNIGHEFALHGNTFKAIRAFELARKVAKSDLEVLQSTGFLFDVCQKPVECDVCDNLQGHDEDVISYLLSKATAYFNFDLETSHLTFVRALELKHNLKGCLNPVLKARFLLLDHKFKMLPCRYDLPDHYKYLLVKIHNAVNTIRAYYTESTNLTSYDMRVFFDIHETLARMYFDLRLPREVRCYSKEGVLIAQKMVLPLRTATFLCFLIHADVTTLRFDDCRVKLKDFSDILGVTSSFGSVRLPEKQKIDLVVQEFKEMMLDVPIEATPFGSPVFASEGFKSAPSLSHDRSCECFYCTCWEYQDFVLKNALLQALLHQFEGNVRLTKEFFDGFRRSYEVLRSRSDIYRGKVEGRVAKALVPCLVEKLSETRYYFLLEYTNFLIRLQRLEEANKLNKETLDKIQSSRIKSFYLYNELLMQRLNILLYEQKEEEPVLVAAVENCGVKTPPPRSKLVVSPMLSLKLPQNTKVQPKVLTFDNSDDEEDQFVRPSFKKTPKVKSETPQMQLAKTTKLLTEKLRSSSKTRVDLTGEMEGAVRRSARNKK